MKYGAFELNLQELAMFLVTLWGGLSYWWIKLMKARALAAKGRPEDIETKAFPTAFPTPTTNPGGPDAEACRGPADPS